MPLWLCSIGGALSGKSALILVNQERAEIDSIQWTAVVYGMLTKSKMETGYHQGCFRELLKAMTQTDEKKLSI